MFGLAENFTGDQWCNSGEMPITDSVLDIFSEEKTLGFETRSMLYELGVFSLGSKNSRYIICNADNVYSNSDLKKYYLDAYSSSKKYFLPEFDRRESEVLESERYLFEIDGNEVVSALKLRYEDFDFLNYLPSRKYKTGFVEISRFVSSNKALGALKLLSVAAIVSVLGGYKGFYGLSKCSGSSYLKRYGMKQASSPFIISDRDNDEYVLLEGDWEVMVQNASNIHTKLVRRFQNETV